MKYQGIHFVSWQRDEYLSEQTACSLDDLAATGANWVSVLTTWYQPSKESCIIAPDPLRTPSTQALSHAIQECHSRDLRVMLKPHVDSLDDAWRGNFQPRDRSQWFTAYSAYLVQMATLAQRLEVEAFCIGTELKQLTDHVEEWLDLIHRIRAVFTGKLTYAANAASTEDEFCHVGFWNELDFIGLDAYFPIHGGWTKHIDPIRRLADRFSKPVVFTEIGYRSAVKSAVQPWDHQRVSPYDPHHQAHCYERFFEAWSRHGDWMQGAFWWNWTVKPPSTGDTGYNPRHKPAAAVLAQCFKLQSQNRVQQLKQQIANGEYQIKSLELSRAIVRRHTRPKFIP